MAWQDINISLVGSLAQLEELRPHFDSLQRNSHCSLRFHPIDASENWSSLGQTLRDETSEVSIFIINSENELEHLSELAQLSFGETALIVLTSTRTSHLVERCIACGVDDILDFTSLTRDELSLSIDVALARRRYKTPFSGESRVLSLLASGQPLPSILTELIEELEARHPDMLCSILIVDSQSKTLLHGAAPRLPAEYNSIVNGFEIGPDKGSCGTAAWLGKRIIVSNIQESPLWEPYRNSAERYGLAACWSQPIFAANGRVIGTFAIYYREPRAPRASELRLMEKAASVAGIAITQRETEFALRYRFDFERLVLSLSNRFISSSVDSLDRVLEASLQNIGEFTRADRCSIFLVSDDGQFMSNSHEWCRDGVRSERNRLQNVPTTSFPWLQEKLERHQVVLLRRLSDLPQEAREEHAELVERRVGSFVAVPLIQSSHLFGLLTLESVGQEKMWTSDVVVLLKMCTQLFANALERKRVEEELHLSKEQSLRNEAQLRVTFETAQIGMATCTLAGKFLSVNSAFCRMIGKSAEELLRLSFKDISAPDERTSRRKMRDFLRGRERQIELEKRFVHSSGGVVHVNMRLGAIFDNEQKPLYLVAEIEDITQKKKWEAEYLKASKLESLGVLAGGIAHDFNNILMAILGTVSKTKIEVEQDSRVFHRLKDVEQAVFRARDLTHQLLTFSKGGAPIKRTASMAEIIRQTIGFSLSGSEVSLTFEAPENLWPVQVDSGQISQVIHNLILNASQSMPEGGSLVVSCFNLDFRRKANEYSLPLESGKYVKIKFRDEGCGIPPENLPKIFDPFFTTKDNGSGLGLATTYSIIKRHQGHIEVDSSVGKGTCFTVFLPASPRANPSQNTEEPVIRQGHGRILLMDDEAMVRSAAEGMLRVLGYEVDSVVNGFEAIERYQRARDSGQPFDAVIMDLTIPGGMGGKVAIRKLKRLDPNVRAIVSSGYADGPVMAEFKKFGFRGVMAKPYEISTLSTVLLEVLAKEEVC